MSGTVEEKGRNRPVKGVIMNPMRVRMRMDMAGEQGGEMEISESASC
jgi:hypothetical protein